ncbi:MAG TPA: phosphoenolpyruvate--protein phosphotransferase [Pirellulales bacterium]|nr:phosphoenolpyruvate--protein phosphotransferase [Pirellulales bacterium]
MATSEGDDQPSAEGQEPQRARTPSAARATPRPAPPLAGTNTRVRNGLSVSPGVAVGKAYCIHEIFVGDDSRPLEDAQVLGELAAYDRAREQTAADLRALATKVERQVGVEQAAIFHAHEAILKDPAFTAKVRAWIVDSHQRAASALKRVLAEYTQLFDQAEDEYIKERLADLRDVVIRLSGHLSAVLTPYSDALPGPIILIANELVPSHVVTLGDREVAGIVTQRGGRTSHAAILARSRGVPAVSGVPGILQQVKTGDIVAVDGREGHVLINPDPETQHAYRKLQREFVHLKDALAANHDLPAVSADGQSVELLANISNLNDAIAATQMGASGVGLYRTEYLFLTHPNVPDEEEQVEMYRAIIAASPNHRITIRTLDLGGDKTIPYLGHDREANPFMGWRSIRLSFEHPTFFMAQIRAVLRAAASAPAPHRVRLMFPMITTLEEMRKVRRMAHQAARQLAAEGRPFAEVPLGMMLEVPAAAVSIQALLKISDFVSIGSNDLVQYLMAADRDNPKVSHLCQPLSPAVLHVLNNVIGACRAAGKPVTVCGEMAGAPRACVLLYAMGLRSFSMSPAFVPTIKDLLKHLHEAKAAEIVERALRLTTANAVVRYMERKLLEIAPDLKMLDSA